MAARPAYQTQRPDRVSEVTVTVSAGDDRLRTIRAAAELAGISPLLDTGAPSRRWPLFVLSAGKARAMANFWWVRGAPHPTAKSPS
jgi:hypothetical protein